MSGLQAERLRKQSGRFRGFPGGPLLAGELDERLDGARLPGMRRCEGLGGLRPVLVAPIKPAKLNPRGRVVRLLIEDSLKLDPGPGEVAADPQFRREAASGVRVLRVRGNGCSHMLKNGRAVVT